MAIKKHIPNTITCCNLVSGCVAIAYAFSGKIELSFTWIIIGAVFDFFDGMSARLLKVSSPIGKELDSLADIVTFGVAPSTILFSKLSVMPYPDLLDAAYFLSLHILWLHSQHCAWQSSILTNDKRSDLSDCQLLPMLFSGVRLLLGQAIKWIPLRLCAFS